MDITFVVTGKAGKSGHEQWRKVNDEDFSTRIYSHSKREASEASRLEIELREFKGDVFTYYTYLIVKNVAQVKSKEDEEKHEKHGRTGSFFGMTIRIKGGYIPNVLGLYNLFEKVFEQRIRGSILTDENTDGYLTFLVEKLSEGEDSFILAEKDILSAVSSADILDLPDDCATQQHKTGEIKTKFFNVVDTGHRSFLQALFNDAEVNVSRDYDTIEEIEIRRKQAEEQKKKEEKMVISELSSNNSPVSSDRHRDSSFSSSNISREPSSSQSQTISEKSNTPSSQCDYSSQTSDQYNRLLLKLISIVLETCKVLLAFVAWQKFDKKSVLRGNSELHEYETKLHRISKELEEVKKQGELIDKTQKRDSFSLFTFNSNFDYKLLIPLGVIIIIIIGFFLGMHNSDDANREGKLSLDTLQVTDAKKDTIDTISIIPDKKDTIFYTVVDSDTRLRKDPKDSNHFAVIPVGSIFKGTDSTVIDGKKWICGIDDKGQVGWTKRSNFK